MTLLDVRRHAELFDPHSFTTPIHVIGAGATGSWLALQLAKLGIQDITIYDFDTVEEHNIPNQGFDMEHIGKPKVVALYDVIKRATGTKIKFIEGKYERQRLAGVVFLMVDSMAERKRIWEQSIKMKQSVQLLIEPRMGLNMGRVYNVHPTNLTEIKAYEDTFYSDEDAEVSACGTSMTVITTAMATSAWCARSLINHHSNIDIDNEILIDYMYNNIVTSRWE